MGDGYTVNYLALARAITAQACLDWLALRFSQSGACYLRRWYHDGEGDDAGGSGYPDAIWIAKRKLELECYFSDGGGDLARGCDCYHYIRKAQTAKLAGWRVWRGLGNERKS